MLEMERNHGEDTRFGKEYNDGKLRSMPSQYGRNPERNAGWRSTKQKRKLGTEDGRKGKKGNTR